MSAKVLKKCPECKKMKLVRLIGAGSGVIFKGTGFYETDYKRKKEKKKSDPKVEKGKQKSETKKDK